MHPLLAPPPALFLVLFSFHFSETLKYKSIWLRQSPLSLLTQTIRAGAKSRRINYRRILVGVASYSISLRLITDETLYGSHRI